MIESQHIMNDSYILYNDGMIWSNRRNRWLKPQTNNSGYHYYFLYGKWYFIHRLIYTHFIGDIPAGKEINHIDMNKANNRYDNLELTTHRDNIIKARMIKNWKSGRKKGYEASKETKQKQAKICISS